MSCYNSENGKIIIPSAKWAEFRKGLLTLWNAKQETVLADALRAHKAAEAAAKGKRGKVRQDALLLAIAQACGGTINQWGGFEARGSGSSWGGGRDDTQYEKWETITHLICDRTDGEVALKTPKKKDLTTFAITQDARIDCGDATVTFTNATKTVGWYVSENNRAVESAHDHWFAKALFAALNKMEWTRGSGGKIIGNDEYNRDSDHEGGGGNYVTFDFHPLTKAEKEAKARQNRSYGYSARW